MSKNTFDVLVISSADNLWVTQDSLEILESIGNIKRLEPLSYSNIYDLNQAFDDYIGDIDAMVFAPWGNQGIPSITSKRLDDAVKLKVIAGTFDFRFDGWLNVGNAERSGICVIDTSRSMTPTVAEFALAMILNLLRDIPHEIECVRKGKWRDDWYDLKGFVSGDLTGKRVGLAGFGSICHRLSELLRPFCCQICSYDPFVSDAILQDHGVNRADSLEELASWSEIFVVGVPPMPNTIKIIDEKVINALPEGSLFVLVTRMAVVDQSYLWTRVNNGDIRVAVDVFDPEPPPSDSPIRTDSNILPTPHLAGNAAFAHKRCFKKACKDTVNAIMGKRVIYEVTNSDIEIYSGKMR